MNREMQAWAFFAGANSIFLGEKLLTADNPDTDEDRQLFIDLGIKPLDLAAFNAKKTVDDACELCN